MTSSGMKRGLAAVAVSALAVTGLPALAGTANAVSLSNSVATADSVVLAAPATNMSTKNDGQNSTVRLEALGGNNVASVKFEYQIGAGAFNTIATVSRNDNGAFSHEWAAAGLDGATVNLRATGLAADGTTVGTPATTSGTVSSTADSVNVNDGAQVGVFQKPDYDGANDDVATNPADDAAAENVIVSGTASKTNSTPALAWWDADTNAAAGNQPAWVADGSGTSTTASGATTGTWAGVMNINGYDYGTGDELLVRATDGTDDAEGFALYKQAITTVTASADRTDVPAGQTAAVTVTVKDQNGNPIAGAEVRDSDGTLIGQTNRNGQVTTAQNPGTKYYYANATASNAYEPEVGDKKSDSITVTQYAPAPKSLDGNSADGDAFDNDEYSSGDITVQVLDQKGNEVDSTGQALQYYWIFTPTGGGTVERTPATGTLPGTPTANAGEYVVELPSDYQTQSGTYELFAGLTADPLGNDPIPASKVLTVKAGEATITYDEASPEQALAGTTEVVDGQLTLPDGTGLPNRQIDLTYTRGTGTDASPDSGFVQSNGTIGLGISVKTAADGSFSVTVKDPAETPQGTELDNKINGGTVDSNFNGVTGLDGNAGAPAPANHEVDFVANLTPGTVAISPVDDTATRPGEAVNYSVTVMSADQDSTTPDAERIPLANQEVTLTIDHGFFTDGSADPAAAEGADAGELKSLGQSITVQTNGSGVATFKVAIERDAGFDDDGLVTSIITAKAGAVTDTEDQHWTSANPLNGGKVRLEFSPDAMQQSGVLPKAPVDDSVYMDVFAEDQFGNLVGGEHVTISENGANASIDTDAAGAASTDVVTDFAFDRDVTADATAAGDQKVTATWVTETLKYNASKVATPGTETLTDDLTVEWYEVDFSKSSFSLTHSGDGSEPVGATVVETYKATDQFGEEISDLYVSFFRSGPDNLQDGDGNFNGFLGQDGVIEYVYQGAKAGTATVTAVGRDGGASESIVPAANRTDSVTFGGTTRQPIQAELRLKNQADGDDVAKVNAPSAAAGAKVKLFKIKKDGTRVLLAVKTANAKGNAKFVVNDTKPGKVTTYKAKVGATAKTFADWTPKRSIK